MWHQWFNCNFTKLREYFLCAKKTKSNDFIQHLLLLIPSAALRRHCRKYQDTCACFLLHVNNACSEDERRCYMRVSNYRIFHFGWATSLSNFMGFYCFLFILFFSVRFSALPSVVSQNAQHRTPLYTSAPGAARTVSGSWRYLFIYFYGVGGAHCPALMETNRN